MIAFFAWLAGCDGDHKVDCAVEIVDRPSLVSVVRWSSDAPGDSQLTWSWDEGSGESEVIADPEATEHAIAVLGAPALTDVDYLATTKAGKRSWRCEGSFRTGGVPSGSPEVEVTVYDASRVSSEPYLVGSLMGSTDSPVFVLDREGHYRWYYGGLSDYLTMMAAPSPQGGLTYIRHGRQVGFRDGEMMGLDLVAGETWHEDVPGQHHPFRELPDGTVLFARIEPREVEVAGAVRSVVGDTVVERAPDGTERVIFSTWDHIALKDEIVEHLVFYPEGVDWVHGNGLFWVAERDTVLFSMAHIRTVVEIERSTGNIVRSFRGADDWTLDGDDYVVAEGEKFRHQHDPRFDDQGRLVVFGTNDLVNYTGGHVYEVDTSDHTLHEAWSYVPDVAVPNWALGQVQDLENGNRMVAFNIAGVVQEVTPEGEVVWEMRSGINSVFGQVYLRNELP